ncbi:MAG TPA: hypothetical protein VK171_01915 [Fimbriimonas sp.]|nr:hypothetical protein [Fimbriimonas sp.]
MKSDREDGRIVKYELAGSTTYRLRARLASLFGWVADKIAGNLGASNESRDYTTELANDLGDLTAQFAEAKIMRPTADLEAVKVSTKEKLAEIRRKDAETERIFAETEKIVADKEKTLAEADRIRAETENAKFDLEAKKKAEYSEVINRIPEPWRNSLESANLQEQSALLASMSVLDPDLYRLLVEFNNKYGVNVYVSAGDIFIFVGNGSQLLYRETLLDNGRSSQ